MMLNKAMRWMYNNYAIFRKGIPPMNGKLAADALRAGSVPCCKVAFKAFSSGGIVGHQRSGAMLEKLMGRRRGFIGANRHGRRSFSALNL